MLYCVGKILSLHEVCHKVEVKSTVKPPVSGHLGTKHSCLLTGGVCLQEVEKYKHHQGSTLAVVNSLNTTGFSILASEIPLVTSHVDYQNYGSKFLYQLQKINLVLTQLWNNAKHVQLHDEDMLS